MCGIAGIYYFDQTRHVESRLIELMVSRMRHRGPNGQGVFLDGNVGLGHARLSVIDLEGGAQPMTDPDSGRTIVYNGEFFNFSEVRENLSGSGVTFRSQSDTEVLLKLAGDDVWRWMPRVNGMFAFGVWDARSRALALYRDRFGVKPLYYAQTPEGLFFASEIKALLGVAPGIGPTLNEDAVSEYLAFRHVLEPDTLFKGVRQLPSGHFLRVNKKEKSIEILRYWSETDELSRVRSQSQREESFGGVFHRAVQRRLVSDVPLGSFNSGGVDSSLVTREVRRQRGGELHTFSVGFAEPEHDESEFAAEVAEKLGTVHHAEYLPAGDYAALLPKAIWHHDEPLCHPHSVHLMHLSSVAKQYVTVVLTGEGADEAFFGYPRLHIARIGRLLGLSGGPVGTALHAFATQARLRRLAKLGEVLGNAVRVEIDSHRFVPLNTLRSLGCDRDYVGARSSTLDGIPRDQSLVEFLLEYERSSYMKSLLLRLDKMTMAHGLEARTPFLDFELVLWSKQLGSSEKVGLGWENKRVLKKEAVRHFSTRLVKRRKVGFGVPLSEWFRHQSAFRGMLADLGQPGSFVSSIMPVAQIRALVHEHCQEGANHTEALWGLLNLELWSTVFKTTASA